MFVTSLDKARQWAETGFIILMLGILLYNGPSYLAAPQSYGWVWRGLLTSFAFAAQGLSFF